jgi:hypothetical protein
MAIRLYVSVRFDFWIGQAEDEQGLDYASHVRVVMGCDHS